MTELAMSDANPPARVSLLTLVSFRGVGIFWETPGQFRVSSRLTGCVVKRRWSTAGVTRPGTGSLHPVAIRAAVEATRLLKPLVQSVARRLGEHAGRNAVNAEQAPKPTMQ